MCTELAKLGYNVIFCDGLFIEDIGKTVLYKSYPSGGKLHICYNINKYIESLGDPAEANHIFYFSYGKTAGTGKFIKAMFNIWDYLDDFPSNRIYDETAFKNADAVIATSKILYEKAQEKFNGPVEWIQNGCNPDLTKQMNDFLYLSRTGGEADVCVPAPWNDYEMSFTYIGAVAPWIAWKHLFKFADFLPERSYINLVGRHFYLGNEFNGIDLKYLINAAVKVRDFGHVNYDNLIPYYALTKCFLLPFVTEKTTDSKTYLDIMAATNPIKFWDYLATERPIITSRIPEIVRITEENDLDWVFFADTFEEMKDAHAMYKSYVSESKKDHEEYFKKKNNRQQFVAKHTWTQRAQQMDDLIIKLLEMGIDHRNDSGMARIF